MAAVKQNIKKEKKKIN